MQARVRRWGTLLLTIVLLVSACGEEVSESEQQAASFATPRPYEQLDLTSPETAVAEFTSAFVRRDYVTAALVLHPDAQRAITTAIEMDDLSALVTTDAEAVVLARMAIEQEGDHLLDALRVFEIAMEEAMANGGFRVDLASGVEGVTVRTADQFTAVVDAISSANGRDVVFELAPTPDERWRVRSVRSPDGTPLQVPFSGEPTTRSTPRNTEARDVWRSTLPNGSPQELLDTLIALVDVGDHVSIFLLLDGAGQRGIADALTAATNPNHALVASVFDARADASGFPFDFRGVEPIAAETLAIADDVAPGEAITFAVVLEEGALDVTMARDSTGAWRLRRMAPAGELSAPTPFRVG